jgi:nickel-dependent lactate racemase
MAGLSVKWGYWYGDRNLSIDLPHHWHCREYPLKDSRELSEQELEQKLLSPIAAPQLSELASGKRSAVIVSDDISRPTQAYRILPLVIEQIKQGGIPQQGIRILIAQGAHRAMTRLDHVKKFGKAIVSNYQINHHTPYENYCELGVSSRGTPIQINKLFMDAELRVTLGSILPHPLVNFGGGAKIIFPGIGGIDTLEKTHRPALHGITGGMKDVDSNLMRQEIEEIVKRVGLDFSMNVVVNSEGKTAGFFCGDFIAAHREGVKFLRSIYATEKPRKKLDIAVVNAYPCDTEFILAIKALNVFHQGCEDTVKKGGTIVLISASTEGKGVHYLSEKGMRVHVRYDADPRIREILAGRRLCIFSPNILKQDAHEYFPPEAELYSSWNSLKKRLEKVHGDNAEVGVFPCSTLQLME